MPFAFHSRLVFAYCVQAGYGIDAADISEVSQEYRGKAFRCVQHFFDATCYKVAAVVSSTNGTAFRLLISHHLWQ